MSFLNVFGFFVVFRKCFVFISITRMFLTSTIYRAKSQVVKTTIIIFYREPMFLQVRGSRHLNKHSKHFIQKNSSFFCLLISFFKDIFADMCCLFFHRHMRTFFNCKCKDMFLIYLIHILHSM